MYSQGIHARSGVACAGCHMLIDDLKAAREAGKIDDEMAIARNFQRRASFLLDFAEAENSVGFHAPQEGARILAQSIDASLVGQLSIRGALATPPQPQQKASTPPAPTAPGAPVKVAAVSPR